MIASVRLCLPCSLAVTAACTYVESIDASFIVRVVPVVHSCVLQRGFPWGPGRVIHQLPRQVSGLFFVPFFWVVVPGMLQQQRNLLCAVLSLCLYALQGLLRWEPLPESPGPSIEACSFRKRMPVYSSFTLRPVGHIVSFRMPELPKDGLASTPLAVKVRTCLYRY